MARAYDQTPTRSFDEDYGYFDGPDPIVILDVATIDSQEALGSNEFVLTLQDPNSIASLENVSNGAEFKHYLYAEDIHSEEAFSNDAVMSVLWVPESEVEDTWTGLSDENSTWSQASSLSSSWEEN